MTTKFSSNSFSLLSYKKLNNVGQYVAIIAAILFLALPQSILAGKKTVNFTPTMLDPAGKIMPSTLRGWLSADDKNAHMGKTCDKYWNDTLLWQMSSKNLSTIAAIATVSGQKMWQFTSSTSTPNGYLMYGQVGSGTSAKYGLFSNLYVLGGTINFNNANNIAAYFYVGKHNCSASWTGTGGTAGLATTTGVVTNNADKRHMYCQQIPNGANSSLSLPASSDIFTYPNITKEYALLFKWSTKSATFYVKNIEFIYAIPEIVNYTNQLEVEYDGEAPEEGQSIVKEWIFNTKEVVAPSDLRLKVNNSGCAYPGCFAIVQQDGADFKYTPGSNGAGTVSVKVQYTASAASVEAGNVTSPVYTLETTSVCDPSAADPGTGSGQYEAKDVDFSLVVAHAVTGPITNTLAWNIDETQLANTTWTQTEYLKTQNSEEPIHIEIVSSTPSGVAELLTGDQIHFVKAGTVTIRATQDANSEVQAADITRTFTISRRTAILAYSESTLFVNTEYPGLISVTNDPNGTLLPNLSYSDADTYMDIEETGDVATKSARTASTTLTITYAGDDEWNPVSTTHDFKVVNKLPAPPFCLADLDNISERVSDGVFITKETNGSFAWNGSALQVTTTGNTYTLVTVRFDGIPNKISFTPSTNIQNLTIKESNDGVSFASIRTDASATAGTKVEVAFTKPASRYVQIGVRVSGSGGTVNLNNFCISDKPMFTVSPSVAYVKTDGITSTPAVIRVAHNDMRSIDVTSSDPDFTISEWTTESGSPIGEGNNGVVQAEVDFVGSNYSKIATLTLTGEPSSGDNIIQTVTIRLNATHDRHYAKGRAYVVSESGSGTVYVGATEDAPVSSAYRVNSETQKYCSAEMGETDDLTFHYWAKAGAGYEFEGWYGMYEEETAELSDLISSDEHFSIDLHATSTNPENPTTGTLYANFIESVAADAPIFALEDLNLGSVVSGEGNLQGNLVLQPVGEATRPLYIDRDRTTVAFTDIAGHEGEAALFSAGAYSMGLKAFAVTFAQTGVHPTAHTYQALATVTATNDMGTTIHTAVVSATVTPAALASFTVDASHTFADKQRNQSDSWNAVVGSLTNATTTPIITITGANAEYFSAGAWDAENHLFPITFAPTAVGANYTATATISVQNYDEVETSHTITLQGTCVAAPAAVYDVKDSENQSVVGGDLYFGDFNPGEQATRKLYLVDIANMKEASGYVPTISMEPDIEGEFVSAAYNASTHSFDVTFHAYGRTDEEMGVRSVPVTITMLNNDDAPVFKEFTLSAFVVKPADFDVRVTSSTGTVLVEGTWAEGLAEANKTANAGCTLTLMRNVTGLTSYQTITNTFTLELNGKKLSGKSNGSIIYVNGTGQTLTIRDNKGNGIIENINNAYAGIAYGVNINAGSLVLHSGTVYVENKGASGRKAVGINVKANTNATINGGKVEVYGYNDTYGVFHASDQGSNINITLNNGEIYTEGYQNIYGIVAYSQVNINGGTIGAKATYTNSRGIFLGASASTTASSCYNGVLTMTGGTINSTCTADADGERLAYGIYFSCSNAAMGDATATDGSHANKAAAVGTISNATINASTLGQKAYGVWANGSYNSKTNTYDKIQINNSTINATANYYYSYGVYATGDINSTHGAIYFANIELNDCEVNATTTKNHTAYGVWATTTARTIFQADQPKYYGEYAGGATITVNGGTYTATTGTVYAYAIGTSARSKTVYDPLYKTNAERRLSGAAEGYATLNINGGTFIANAGTTTARAVSNGGNCTIIGGEFYATTGTTTADGIYNLGRLTATGAKIVSTATTNTAYGVRTDVSDIPAGNQAWTGFTYRGESELNNLDVTVKTGSGSTAYGVYANAKALLYTTANFETQKTSSSWSDATYTIYKAVSRLDQAFADSAYVTVNGGTYTVTAETNTAYGAFSNTTAVAAAKAKSASAVMELNNATFTVITNQTTEARGIYASGNTTIDGCVINATAKTNNAYGVLVADRKTIISNTQITATATAAGAYGIYGTIDINGTHAFMRRADIELNNGNEVLAKTTTGNTAYALYLNATKKNIASGTWAGDYAVAAKAVVNGGKYTAQAAGTTGYALCVAAQQVQGAAVAQPKLTVNDGKFKGTATSTYADINASGIAGDVVINGGYYLNTTNLNKYAADGKVVTALASTRAEYTEGYRYEIALPGGNYVCQIGSTKYKTLEEALSVVTSGQTIYMIADYTLPAGDYILPSGATLLIPYTTTSGKGGTTAIGAAAVTTTSATTPTLFRKLTFASGANLTSFGIIETSAQQKANGQYGANVGMASGPYGQLELNEGSHIEMENGANLYCWGFVTGKGTINVKKGANTLEGFQLGDWCGGTNASNLIGNSQKVFPITHYFFQSIECPITYRPGSTAKGSTHINVSFFGVVGQDAVSLVGTSGAMFLMTNEDASADTWVMRDYDETTDQSVWTLNSGASIGNLTINISSYNMASKDYDLPIASNMSIVMNYGTMSIGQNAVFLPGSKLIVNKEGTLDINGVSVVAYDKDDWTGTTRYYATYSPSWGTTNPRKSIALQDAEFFVHGKINIRGNGGIYTSEHGANVHSTNEDAGEVVYNTEATGNKTSYFLVQGGTNKTALTVNPARLKNGVADPAFSPTAGTVKNKTWIYYDDQWQCWTQDEYCFYRDEANNPYAKPNGYVALNKQDADDPDDPQSLIHDAATGTRGFIWDENCYWWEVNPTPVAEGVYQTIQPDHNGKYNYYEFNEDAWYWIKKNVTVTWNGDGVTTTNYTNVGYGTHPKWLGATPTKSGYVWDGWTIGGAGTVYTNDNLPIVTSNTTFTSHFVANPVKYNITFKNPDGKVLDSRNWESGSTPSYAGTPEREATADKTYTWAGTWSPAITTVSATAEYTAQYNETTRQYDVTFLDYDNTVLETKKVNYNAAPTYTGDPSTPTRVDPTDTYIYTFSGWKNQQTGTSGLTAVKGDQIYVAQYTQTIKWAFISFADYNGTTITTGKVLRGTAPTPPANPTRESDAQYIYSFNAWSPAITNADENQTYTATYNTTLRSYTIRFVDYKGDNLKDPQVLPYGSKPTAPTSVPDKSESEEFANWDDVIRTVSEAKDYIAQYRTKRYTLTIASNNTDYGTVSPTSLTNIPHGSTVAEGSNTFTVDGKTVTATPTDATAQYTYTFDHWANLPATITGNKDDIQAVFTRTLNQYTITGASAGNGSVSGSGTYDYGATATLTATPDDGYRFDHWNDDNTDNPRSLSVTATATYTASFVLDETGDYLDIVGATATTLTINANPLTLSKWPYTINGVKYRRAAGDGTLCNADRTITFTHDKAADEQLTITVTDKTDAVVSRRKYTIPHVYESDDAILSGTNANSIVFVNSGTLTVSGVQTAKAIYVSAGAELNIEGTLYVEKLVLRTSPWAAAILTNNGTISATNTYYSRVVADNSKFYQFGLPCSSTTTGVIMSDGSTPSASSWQMKEYSESKRAEKGVSESGENWVALSSTTIEGGKGYEIYSGSKYYREYCFPVTIAEGDAVAVQRTGDDKANSGWNIIVSPKMGKFVGEPKPEDITITVLQQEGGYVQEIPEVIMPAVPFSYQASATGMLNFGSTLLFNASAPAPRRKAVAEEAERIQWIHLDIADANGSGDQTSIYSHPTRYDQVYQTGIDVAKQSLTASRAIIYSSHAYGDMAFAGVADTLLEQGVALTVYSPSAQELTISMRENDWLNRMEYVWLVDHETGARTDLLWDTYTFDATEGTARGRFTIEGVFRVPQITTDIENGEVMNGEMMKVRKVLINQKMYIIRGDQMYDATGKKVSK